MSYKKFKTKYELGQGLSTMFETFRNATKSPNCDKKEIGFNKDDRFCSGLRVTLFISSLRGTYGSSSCSPLFRYTSDQNAIFKKYFVKYLNDNFKSITSEVGKAILSDLEKEKNEAKTELLKQLEVLESLNSKKDDVND